MRPLNPAAAALLARIEAGEQIPLVQLVELGFSPVERYTTAGYDIEWGGNTWGALGMQIEPVTAAFGDMPGLSIALPAITPEAIALALADDIEGVTLRLYDAIIDPDTGEVAQAVLAWSGTLTQPQLEDGRTAAVTLNAEHRGVVALRPKVSRYTNDEQQRLYPGDTSLDFDPATDAGPLVWPAASFFRI
jgi:hypothetical protein